MPNNKDELKEQVLKLYVQSYQPKEISRQLHIPLALVRQLISKTRLKRESKGIAKIKEIIHDIWPSLRIIDEYPIGRQFIDLYIPNFNVGIEYDGEFHYKDSPFGAGGFMRQFERDSLKDELCADAGIKLIRISYKDIKNIDQDFFINAFTKTEERV